MNESLRLGTNEGREWMEGGRIIEFLMVPAWALSSPKRGAWLMLLWEGILNAGLRGGQFESHKP